MTVTGFIVHSFVQNPSNQTGSRLAMIGRATDGSTFAAVIEPYFPPLYIRQSDQDKIAGPPPERVAGTDRSTIDGEAVVRCEYRSLYELRSAGNAFASAGVRTYEADLSQCEPYLLDHHIRGTVRIEGDAVSGHTVDHVFINPRVAPVRAEIALSTLSLDIETEPQTNEILAIGLQGESPWREPLSEVLYNGTADAREITAVAGERDLLEHFVTRVREFDPDIITGWNVIEFDLAVIAERAKALSVELNFSRAPQPAEFLPSWTAADGRRQAASFICPGRQALDGLRLVRYGPQQYGDRKLDSVAQAVLGRGKTIDQGTSAEKLRTLRELRERDPVTFCRYCLNDAELVLRILEKTGLLSLTIQRTALTGVGLHRAWTSIPAFEFLYLEEMHARGLVAPTLGVDRLPQGEAPGGAILKPHPGLFSNVLVFDFKSLYPSIIRTFAIDPVGYRGTDEGYPEGTPPPADEPVVVAPNGARFSREEAILPSIIDRFWQERDAAKSRSDSVASYVYKIVMNSFYGVLGTSGCRFAGRAIAGAITSFGQYILRWSRDRFVRFGCTVIYGDTDSLFVLTPDTDEPSAEALCRRLNDDLARFIREHFGVESQLELEFEKEYRRFYLPTVRHVAGSEARGRAKGYAGQPLDRNGTALPVEIRGMEAARSDWTPVAAQFQRELLEMLFSDAGPEAIGTRIGEQVRAVREGEIDAALVYSRRLRKSVASYTKSSPPHVQAARLLPEDEQEGTIDYVITVEGPQPARRRHAKIDYEHYVERQLRPIAEPICEVAGVDAKSLFDPSHQLSLF